MAETERERAHPLHRALALHIRSIVRSRLVPALVDDDVRAEADLAWTDALAASALLREGVLQGETAGKHLLGESVQRLARLLARRPDRGPALAQRVEDALRDCLEITGGVGPAVSAAATLSVTLADIVLNPDLRDPQAPVRPLVRSSQAWADDAVAQLERFPALQEDWLLGEVGCAVALSLAAAVASTTATDVHAESAQRLFALLARRWEQLERLSDQLAALDAPDSDVVAGIAEFERSLAGSTFSALDRLVESTSSEASAEVIWGEAIALRMLIHQLPSSVWERGRPAGQIMAPQQEERDPRAQLQVYLDRAEVAFLGTALDALVAMAAGDLVNGAHDAPELEAAVSSGALVLVQVGPPVGPGHLTAALQRRLPAEDMLSEQEVAAMLEAVRQGDDSALGSAVLVVFAAMADWMAQPDLDSERLQADVEGVVERVCLPLAREDLALGSKYTGLLLLMAADRFGSRSKAHTVALLHAVDRAESQLSSLGPHPPELALARARLAFMLAQSDGRWFAEVGAAAGAVLEHIDAAVDLPREDSLFDAQALADSIRFLATARLYAQAVAEGHPTPESLGDLLDRLRTLADDPAQPASARAAAARHTAELTMLLAQDHAVDSPPIDWAPLIDTRPIQFLLSIYARDDAAAHDPGLIRRALRLVLAQEGSIGGVSSPHGEYFAVLTSVTARRRLGLGDDERLALGRLALAMLDETSAAAADIAFRVVANLEPLVLDPQFGHALRQLIEDVAERFLPAAIRAPDAAPSTAMFMLSTCRHALNLGAVRAAEFEHRIGTAIAAHVLAVHAGDTDGATHTAYTVAELLRFQSSYAASARWYAVYDRCRATGGLADASFAALRDAIEYDRRQLLEQLRGLVPDG